MCDLPPVDNVIMPDDIMYAFLGDWGERIKVLGRLHRTRYKDEALVLCCCYIQTVGGWLCVHEDPRRAFTESLLTYADIELFRMINLRRLLSELKHDAWRALEDKLKYSSIFWRSGFSPEEEITGLCKANLSEDEFVRLGEQLWRGTLAHASYDILRCDGVHDGLMLWKGGQTSLGFPVFYSALKQIFDRAKDLAIARKLPSFGCRD